jgi:hypothetical protein
MQINHRKLFFIIGFISVISVGSVVNIFGECIWKKWPLILPKRED